MAVGKKIKKAAKKVVKAVDQTVVEPIAGLFGTGGKSTKKGGKPKTAAKVKAGAKPKKSAAKKTAKPKAAAKSARKKGTKAKS
jgi:hypothetical protein